MSGIKLLLDTNVVIGLLKGEVAPVPVMLPDIVLTRRATSFTSNAHGGCFCLARAYDFQMSTQICFGVKS